MKVKEMWRGTLILRIMMVIMGVMISSVGNVYVWIGVGIAFLLSVCFMLFRQGQGYGHEACSTSAEIAHLVKDGKEAQISQDMQKGAWSVQNGVKTFFAGAALTYIINCIYIICYFLVDNQTIVLSTRLVSWILTTPYWPFIAYWHENYVVLTPAIAVVLMVSPFVLPACQLAGYMQGPKLWKKTEAAMAQGKRRAKARSRIIKKKKSGSRIDKPMI